MRPGGCGVIAATRETQAGEREQTGRPGEIRGAQEFGF
jgi:hypothetical protein